jgi:hypothetical protein
MNTALRIIGFVCLMLLTGCLTQPTGFVSSSIPMNQGDYSVLGLEVRGTSTQVSWLFFTFGAHGSSQRHALEDALSQIEGADGLTAMSVDSETFSIMPTSLISFPIFPTFYKIVVTGTPVKLNTN